MFCRKVFDRQLADAAECHLEHPVSACSWKQPEWRNFDGFLATCAQCRLGAEHRGLPHSTVSYIQTTKQLLARVIGFECRCLTHGDSPEEFEKYLLDLQPHVRTCLSLSPSKIFSIDIETCYPVDTVHNSPIDEYKQGMKELATKFDAQTIRTVAKLHDQFGHPSAKALAHELHMRKCPKSWVACAKVYTSANLDSSVWSQSLVHSSSIMWLIQIFTLSSGKERNVAFKRSCTSSHDLRPKLVSNERQCSVKSKVLKNCG